MFLIESVIRISYLTIYDKDYNNALEYVLKERSSKSDQITTFNRLMSKIMPKMHKEQTKLTFKTLLHVNKNILLNSFKVKNDKILINDVTKL